MTTTAPRVLGDLLALAERLAELRTAEPTPLPRPGHHDRDGPTRTPTITAPKRAHGPTSTPPAHSWNWRSKGT